MRSLIGSGLAPCGRIAAQFPLSRRAIFLTVLAVKLPGDRLRNWPDPRLRNARRSDQL